LSSSVTTAAVPPVPLDDHRKGPRRRGQRLEQAILQAALDELAESGYPGLTIERVAARARTGKQSVYRRWPTRAELVVTAVRHRYDAGAEPLDTGNLRDDLLAVLGYMARVFDGPGGEAIRGLFVETRADPARTARARDIMADFPLRNSYLNALRRAVDRGEIRRDSLTPAVAKVGPRLLKYHFLRHGAPVGDEVLTEIVDEIVLPLLRCDAGQREPASLPGATLSAAGPSATS
jgi:AcrR family transcriptional regulator